MLLIILKNLIFNVIILKVISYTLNCKVKFKYILLGSVIGSYRIFIKYIFDIAMHIVTFKSFRSIISYLTILGLYKGINSIPLVLLLYIINTRKKLYYNVIIKYNKKYEQIILNLLGRTVIVDNMETAIKLAKQNGYTFRIVTTDGDLINPSGAITGGSVAKKTVNILGRGKEIEK